MARTKEDTGHKHTRSYNELNFNKNGWSYLVMFALVYSFLFDFVPILRDINQIQNTTTMTPYVVAN